MPEDRATELLSIASMAAQIGKLAADTKPPAVEVSVIAGDIAVRALKLARALLDRDGGNDAAPGELPPFEDGEE